MSTDFDSLQRFLQMLWDLHCVMELRKEIVMLETRSLLEKALVEGSALYKVKP